MHLSVCDTSSYFSLYIFMIRAIYLGETFCSYISINNSSNFEVRDVVIKVNITFIWHYIYELLSDYIWLGSCFWVVRIMHKRIWLCSRVEFWGDWTIVLCSLTHKRYILLCTLRGRWFSTVQLWLNYVTCHDNCVYRNSSGISCLLFTLTEYITLQAHYIELVGL